MVDGRRLDLDSGVWPLDCRYLASEDTRAGCQPAAQPGDTRRYRATGLPAYRITGLPGYRVTGLPDYRLTGSPAYRLTG